MSKALILCVDDDAENLKIRQLLLQTVGYETLCATDASSGLQLFETNDVRIVILDYAMPDLNGAQVARKMRAANPQIPIVMLSGQPVRPPDVDGEVDAFLSKAGGPKLLLQEIERLLSTKKPPSGYPNESNIRKFG